MTTHEVQKAGGREWVGLAVLALPTLLLSLDVSVLYLALPHMSVALGANSTQQLWIMDIYGFLLAGFLVPMGTLGDRIGRRKLLLIGAAVFGLTSILAAFSLTTGMLIAARALLGIAGATLMPSTLGLIRNMFSDPKEMGLAIAIWISCFMGGSTIGPLVGGVLLSHFWWGSAFLLGVPVMLLLLVLGPWILPEHHNKTAGHIDLKSVVLALATLLPIIYGIKELARSGFSWLSLAALVIGLAAGVIFVRRQRTLADPFLDLSLFRHRAFSTALSIGLFSGVVMGGTFLFLTLYLQLVQGLSPWEAGLGLLPQAFTMIIGSLLASQLARRIRPAFVMAGGFIIASAGLLIITLVGSTNGLTVLLTGSALLSLGLALPMTLGTGLLLMSAPPEKAGGAASMSEMSGEFGIALGIAVLGSLGTAVYRYQMANSIPAGVPATTGSAARESLISAIAATAHLPEQLGAALDLAAREAFTMGLHVIAGTGALLFLGLALLVATQLRHIRAQESAETNEAAQVTA